MKQKQTSPSYNGKYDFGKINSLSKIAMNYLDEIYEHFGIKRSYKNEILIKSCCPIHGGDNPTALNMYYNGDFKIHYNIEKMKFGSMVNSLHSDDAKKGLISKEGYREKVVIPAPYYLQRGFSKEILEEYDVGYCDNPNKPMYGRAIVPIYDNEYEDIVGFTARSTFDKCNQCKHYHNPSEKCRHFPKWMHSKGFQKQKWLYNYWRAKEEILKTGVAIIVESPGNVWRLAEAGIHNAVAIFGTALNVDQRHLLDESGALSLICLMDNDDAGQKAAKKIEEQCSRLYRLFFPSFEGNDVADLNIDKVTSDIKPFIENAMGVYGDLNGVQK